MPITNKTGDGRLVEPTPLNLSEQIDHALPVIVVQIRVRAFATTNPHDMYDLATTDAIYI
jgi:hypothetical protein